MATRHGAGIISKIKLENFMCHSSLQIELGDWVNFVTGQNGSKSSFLLVKSRSHLFFSRFHPIAHIVFSVGFKPRVFGMY